MDVMAANGLLRSVIEASQILGVNQDKIPVWKAMQEKMPSYMLNENGEIREWMWKDLQDNHKHRHASHLFGLYDFHDPLIMGNQDLIEGVNALSIAEWKYGDRITEVSWRLGWFSWHLRHVL